MATRILLMIGASIAISANVHARLLEDWPYEKLMKEADLVVIAKAVKTEDTKDEIEDSNWKHESVGQNSTLEILSTLKGKAEGKQIQVLHFKLPKGQFIRNGPLFVTFQTRPVELKAKDGTPVPGAAEYLLYLKRMKDGRFEPVSGRIDPAQAVRELVPPKRPFEIELNLDPKKSPLDDTFATVVIRNNTENFLDLRSTLPFGPLVFLDTAVRDRNEKRVSKEFHWMSVASPFSDARSVGEIPAGKSLSMPVPIFKTVEQKDLVPGKYTLRARFRYYKDKHDIDIISEWLTVDVTEEHLKK